jgi:hypothetical protein
MNGLCSPTALALKQAGLEYLLLDEAQAQAVRGGVREAARQRESPGVGAAAAQAAPAVRAARMPAKELREKDWPAAWRERLEKTRAAPIIWTYWELGQDLCGAPDPQRRGLLRGLLQDLAHPPGTHCFWPLALPEGDGEQPEANAPVFWDGVRLLRGRAVVIMGSQALGALALPDRMLALRPFQQVRHQGRLLIVLPSPDLIIREAQRMQALREFLRRALAPFV